MNFATWSIRNPIPSILLFGLLTIAGLFGLYQLPIQNLPDLDLPTVTITLIQPGAVPAQLETEVARKVEDALATATGLKHTTTSITDGQVQISAEFALERKLSDALLDAKDAVDRVRADLPLDVQPAIVSAVTVGGLPLLTYAASSPALSEEGLSWFVDDTLGKALLAVPGVGRFERTGGVKRQVRIEVDPSQLAAVGATVADVSHALLQVQQQSSGGRGRLGSEEQSIRTIATARQATDLAALPVVLSGGRQVRLDQVASVRDSIADLSQAALLDGQRVVGFNVYRAKGYDETQIAAGVSAAIEALKKRDPLLEVTPISNRVDYSREQYDGSLHMLYEGAILAVIVVGWFLRDWRATLVSAVALPLSIIPTFAAMSWLGFSLNLLTLVALSVVVGILVDDAIVEIENIERHVAMGKSIEQATTDAVTEIALAVIATTMALVAVFLPTAVMKGVPGLFFKQFGWTAVVAVLASLLVARLVTPMLAARLLKPGHQRAAKDGRLMTAYLRAVRWCLSNRKTTMALATAFFVGAAALVPLIPTGFIPPVDQGTTRVDFELPPGASLADSVAVAESLRASLGGIPGIQGLFASVGNAPASDHGDDQKAGALRKGSLTVMLTSRGTRPSQAAIEKTIRQHLHDVPGARFSVGSGEGDEKLAVNLTGDNPDALNATALAFERQLRALGGLSNVSSTASLDRPEITIRPNLGRAADLGVTTAAIGEVVRIATSGDFSNQVSKLNLDTRQVDISVRLAESALANLDSIANLRVPARSGLVRLSSVADISVQSGPSEISRRDRHRYVTVSADLGALSLGPALALARGLPIARNLPSGVTLSDAEEAERIAEVGASFGLAMVTGVLSVYCVLVLLFKDFLQPVTILSAIPLSVGGAFIALLIGHSEFDLPSLIGLVMLMGIVTKNSILLVEYAIVAVRDRGLGVIDALVDACHKRARPIVMTTMAMMAGMLPLALGIGAGASFRQPMATALIGGLVTSTALSLLVVPVVFMYIHGFKQRLGRWFAGNSPDPVVANPPMPMQSFAQEGAQEGAVK